eukprot:TRINITY_DN1088_c0_g1_i3.p1 TRINITY_DN1088_c0_g1~~TRINITY_DN1088_c0_g1_i3.p1  ORF type:complete len:486 (-),score=47.78 TRINITY_DN1088_c0_g1_i3:438-1871(-)
MSVKGTVDFLQLMQNFYQFKTVPYRIMINIVLVFLLFTLSSADLRFGSFRGVPFIFNYTEGDGWCNPSFECEIMSYLCWKLGEGEPCSLTIFESLEERLTALEKNQVDIVVSRFSVSPERAERVDFVRPFYYSSGALLFSAPENKDAFVSYEDLISQSICMDVGYYVSQTLVDDFGLFLFPSSKESVVELINRKYCIATIMDSVFVLDGLVQTDLEPLYVTPYAIAISKSPVIPNLYNNTQKAILEMMTRRENENKSYLEKLEETHLLSQGLSQNSKLSELSNSITKNNGEYIGAKKEDTIWQAANLTTVKKFSEELRFIDPTYDEICRAAMKEIYDSYNNGTVVDKLPMMFNDSVAYTFIISVLDTSKYLETHTVVTHPFLEPGATVEEQVADNPQIIVVIQALKQAFLGDEKNLNEGAFFYVTNPFDASPVFNDPETIMNSPTRVIKTTLFNVLQNKDGKQVLFTGCGVGDLRNW